ncbi:MAG TPA: YciI family protein [bacterium]|nr:YciI family protein [bacterium]
MADFMYLFWNKGGKMRLDSASPEEVQRMMQKWMGWVDQLKKSGNLKETGMPLEMTGKTVRGSGKAVVDGPYPETKDAVGGFMVVTAKDLDEAAELAKGCPILDMGDNSVEVRPVRKM